MAEPPPDPTAPERDESLPRRLGEAMTSGAEAAGVFASLLAGFLLGFFADRWLGTGPGLTIFGILAGAGTGFWKMWQYTKKSDDTRR